MLEGVKTKLSNIVSGTKSKYFMILLAAIVLIVVMVFVYKRYLKQRISPEFVENKEFVEDVNKKLSVNNDISTINFFTVEWCPYCKSALSDWKNLAKKYENQKINGQKVRFRLIDCSDIDNNNKGNTKCKNLEEYEQSLFTKNVNGYPTIIIVKGKYNEDNNKNIFILQSRPTEENIEKFLKTVF
jgi:thiol-disulfide isomerase/thioredoxin